VIGWVLDLLHSGAACECCMVGDVSVVYSIPQVSNP
jgi:hypothetical protein